MNQLDRAYLAGWFDGEGSITIRKAPPRLDRGAKSPVYNLQVGLAQVDITILEWIRDEFAPNNTITQFKKSDKWMPIHQLQLHSRKAARFLDEIVPFLRQKKDEAEIAIRFFYGCINTSPKPLPPEQLKFRESCYQELIRCRSTKSKRGRLAYDKLTNKLAQSDE